MWWHSKYHAEKKYFGGSIHETNKKEKPSVWSFLALFPSTTPHSDPKGQDILVCVIVFLHACRTLTPVCFHLVQFNEKLFQWYIHIHSQLNNVKNRWHNAPMHVHTQACKHTPQRGLYTWKITIYHSRYCMGLCLRCARWEVQRQHLLMTLSTPSRRQRGGRACPERLGTSRDFSWLWFCKTKSGIIFQSRKIICSFEHLLSSHVFPLCPKPRSPGFTSLLSDSSARCRCRSWRAAFPGYLLQLPRLPPAPHRPQGPRWPCCWCCHIFTLGLPRGSQWHVHTMCCAGHFSFHMEIEQTVQVTHEKKTKPTKRTKKTNHQKTAASTSCPLLFFLNYFQKQPKTEKAQPTLDSNPATAGSVTAAAHGEWLVLPQASPTFTLQGENNSLKICQSNWHVFY